MAGHNRWIVLPAVCRASAPWSRWLRIVFALAYARVVSNLCPVVCPSTEREISVVRDKRPRPSTFAVRYRTASVAAYKLLTQHGAVSTVCEMLTVLH